MVNRTRINERPPNEPPSAPPPPPGVNLYITTCVHGVDLRFWPRCYLCHPEMESVLLESKPIRYHVKGQLIPANPNSPSYRVDLTVEEVTDMEYTLDERVIRKPTHDTPGAVVEWRDEIRPWDEHVADWAGSRVPVAGDYIDLPGNGCRKVHAVMWDLDGSCVIRVEFHPIQEPRP